MVFFSCLALAACGGGRSNGLTPLPDELLNVKDPSDGKLVETLTQYIKDKGGPANTSYEFSRIDLDGDGRRDGIAVMRLPFNQWCTGDGCMMVVFKASEDDFARVSEITPVRTPVTISKTRTNGWHDLLMRVDGHLEWPAKSVALRYDGVGYPQDPFYEPGIQAMNEMAEGVSIFP